VAAANSYVAVPFGRVLAIAPATATVLNTDPALVELPLGQLEAIHPLQFLLGSLTQAQFSLLATTGLGMADMTSDQQALFRAMIPALFQVVSSDYAPPVAQQPNVLKLGEMTRGVCRPPLRL
jgi:hypothetical protein